MEERVLKYPRTPHIEGSRLAPGDEDLSQIPFKHILGRQIAIEEKVDGANTAISFIGGVLKLQSRGHFLRGGGREEQYNLFKIWANTNYEMLYNLLGERYIMYGEWMWAKHGIYYDNLPHYFLEFDIYDKEREVFLDTASRQAMLEGTGIVSAPTLAVGVFTSSKDILSYITESAYITKEHLTHLAEDAAMCGASPEEAVGSVPPDTVMEGIYIKCEDGGIVTERMKYVRRAFRQVQISEDAPHRGPIIRNRLSAEGEERFGI